MRRTRAGGAIAIALLLAATPAAAQTRWSDRVRVSLDGMFQPGKKDFSDSVTFEEFQEEGTIDGEYRGDGGPGVNGGLAVRLWKNLGVGFAVSSFSRSQGGSVRARLPHPFHFNRQREVTGGVSGLGHQEMGLHAELVYMVPVSSRVDVLLSAGPSFFRLKQGLVSGVQYAHQYPFDTATFERTVTVTQTERAVGFNVGADVAWMLTRHVGLGALLRVARANVEFRINDRNDVTVDAGGFHTAAGLRIAF